MSVKKELENTKMIVESILEANRLARNNDFYLIICYLRSKGIEIPSLTSRQYLSLSGSISTVLRVRRVIQNVDKKYLPSKKVLEKRRQREKEFRKIPHYRL